MNIRYSQIVDIIKIFLKQMIDPIIVDFGCGRGCVSAALNKIDVKSQAFDLEIKKVKKGICASPGDITAMPLKDMSVDILICSEVLEHLTDEEFLKALSEIDRVLSNQGVIIITVPENKVICMKNELHKRYVSFSELSAFFKNYDLFENKIVYKNFRYQQKNKGNLLVVFQKP